MTNREIIGLVIVLTPGFVLTVGVIAFLLYDNLLVGLMVLGVLGATACGTYLLVTPEKHK